MSLGYGGLTQHRWMLGFLLLIASTAAELRGQDEAPEVPSVSHQEIVDAADSAIEEGFRIRGSSLAGEMEPGKSLAVRQQLFKGNEYVFLLLTRGELPEGEQIEFSVRDERGNPVHVGRVSEGRLVRIRVNPPKTGVYVVVFSLPKAAKVPVGWRLAYGFR